MLASRLSALKQINIAVGLFSRNPHESLRAVLRVARFCYDHFRFIYEDVENLNFLIAVVGIDYLQIYFSSSQDKFYQHKISA